MRAGGTPPFYLLIRLLHAEAQVASRNAELVSEGRLRRYQKRTYATMQGKTMRLWDLYKDGDMSATRLLREMSYLYRPAC